MRKPTFCICDNRGSDLLCSNYEADQRLCCNYEADQRLCCNYKADQRLCCNYEADQRLCFRYMDSTIPLLSKSKVSSLQPSSVLVQLGLCWTGSKTTYWFFHDKAPFIFKVSYVFYRF